MELKRLIAALTVLLLAACQPDSRLSETPPVAELATVISVTVGPYHLRLPLVAITWAGRSKVSQPCEEEKSQRLCSVPMETLVESAQKERAIAASSLEILLDDYSTFKNLKLDRWFDIPQLCEQLTQRWARQQCTGPSLFQDNLRRFTLIKQESLPRVNSLGLIGGQKEPIRQVVQRMEFIGDDPTADCADDGQGLCTVAMQLEGNVLAIWVVAIADVNSIQRQAITIRAFLKYAAGKEENYKILEAALSINN
ncbi:hypothetical protein [Synechococcus elongatus]|uniref:Lipoprotein n=2 Tax=Synechococcus elongatus TaxID=32046 RepID=Q31SA2_SYNE7|nr:hypothetical protein [Synechococcus elongatus]ABB56067.1 conserved hypothetical protein [Synechococcus elongatus PCC 7942 = FACHB-805]AJD56870.1 hypothetical protein M744_02925 [Synechococcus elongatus UTEX 2973]MBD2587900.1 hypothetical protein [Synechococcus elongatus FACHB-242]MBD2688968.1 hypothetical protein [Synechococcus elongatus FACHB-1061]MBD2707392.1 hypothetical protein [Synechococcus elongatus PCC 7942 = FACHB-805]